jgi:site-specific recombinase XerD
LRNEGITKKKRREVDEGGLQRIEHDFVRHLAKERGLSPATLNNYVPLVKRFLAERFGSDPIVLNAICPSDVTEFVIRDARSKSPRTAQSMTTALRVFFRFLLLRGDVTLNLAASVPTVSEYKQSGIPKFLQPRDVERLLKSCDKNTPVGKRDYAIMLLLSRLGLRASEIVALRLDDILWETGVVNIRGKGARHDQLPLPHDVGEALATYIRHGRPSCPTRRVFIRARAPHVGFSGSVAIADIVRRALARAGLDPIRKGSHLLRHSLAVRMLREGASLQEISEILRHSSPNTTEIYAKVDPEALYGLALPWLGGDA